MPPGRVGQRRPVPAPLAAEKTDDADERGVLEQSDEGVDDPRDDMRQRLRQSRSAHLLPVRTGRRRPRPRYCPLSTAWRPPRRPLRPYRRVREQHHAPIRARSRLSKLTPSGRNSGSMTDAMNRTVISGTPAPELDEDDRRDPRHRHVRAAPKRQHDAKRQATPRCR